MYTQQEKEILSQTAALWNMIVDYFNQGKRSKYAEETGLKEINGHIKGIQAIMYMQVGKRLEGITIEEMVRKAVLSQYPGAKEIQFDLFFKTDEVKTNVHSIGTTGNELKAQTKSKKAQNDDEDEDDNMKGVMNNY